MNPTQVDADLTDDFPLGLPWDFDAEARALRALLLQEVPAIGASELTPDDFYGRTHRLLFTTICRVIEQNEPVDILTVGAELTRSGDLDAVGGVQFLRDLVAEQGGTQPPSAAITKVRSTAVLRRLARAASRTISRAREATTTNTSPDEVLTASIIDLFEAANTAFQGLLPLSVTLEQTLAAIEAGGEPSAVASGLVAVDSMIGRFAEGDVVAVAGLPGAGKTSFVLTMASDIALSQHIPVLFLATETTATEIALRLVAKEAKVPLATMRSGDLSDAEWQRVAQHAGRLADAAFTVSDSAFSSLAEVAAVLYRFKAEAQGRVVIIDSLGLLLASHAPTGTAADDARTLVAQLKFIARKLGLILCFSIGLSSKRDIRAATEQSPEFDAAERLADVVLVIGPADDVREAERARRDILIQKARRGRTGRVAAVFEPPFSQFIDLEHVADARGGTVVAPEASHNGD